MKKLIIIILLIVGCAPTKPPTATFYIGMTEKEFINENNINLDKTILFVSKSSDSNKFFKLNSTIVSDSILVVYTEKQNILMDYYFEFSGDTLAHVYAGSKNWLNVKEIDYSKYPSSKPE